MQHIDLISNASHYNRATEIFLIVAALCINLL